MRLVFIIFCLAAGVFAAAYGQPYMKENAEAVTILITVFTVFAGFLIAIIAVLGDPGLIPEGSWRVAEMRRDSIEVRLFWHFWLFVIYLVTIALLFVAVLMKNETSLPIFKEWLERGYLFLGVSSFLLSFALPWSVMQLQKARIDAEIERRREKSGIGRDNKVQEE